MYWQRNVTERARAQQPGLTVAMGVVFLVFGILRYIQEGGVWGGLWLMPAAGAIALGVADYLPGQCLAVAIALRIAFLLSLVVLTVLFFREVVGVIL